MKKLLLFFFTVLALTLFIAAMPTDADADIYDDTVRLHIIANSDSDKDQKLKLDIRDKLLVKYSDELKGYKDKKDAQEAISSKLDSITQDVNKWLYEDGFSYSAKVTLGTEWYDTREYEDFTLPCGYYTSLRIMLGKAEGKNWWCVMYPPMCLDLATEPADKDDLIFNYTDEEMHLISSKKYNYKLKVLEIFSRAFS